MKRMLLAMLVLAIAIPAFAGGNPFIAAYVTFDGGVDLPRVDPVAYSAGEVFICLKQVDAGFTTVSFAVAIDAGVTAPAAWTSLLPGGLAIGDYATGITLSSTECMMGEFVCLASGSMFYLGGPGTVNIMDHPDYPRWVVDCNDAVDFYCYANGGGVLMDAPMTGEDCAPNAIEESTWGGIKALYR